MTNSDAVTTKPTSTKSTPSEAYSDLKSHAGEALDELKKAGQSGRDMASASAEAAVERAREAKREAARSAHSVEDSILDYVDREPLKALAIAAGVGAVVGMWIRGK